MGYSAYTNGTAFVERHYDNATLGKGKFHYNVKYNTESNGTPVYNYDQINSYDAVGRPTSKSQNFLVNQGGYIWKPFTTSVTYDLASNVLSQTYPSGRTVNYAYDTAGRRTDFTENLGGTARNYSTALQYDAAGHLSKETFGTTTPLYQNFIDKFQMTLSLDPQKYFFKMSFRFDKCAPEAMGLVLSEKDEGIYVDKADDSFWKQQNLYDFGGEPNMGLSDYLR